MQNSQKLLSMPVLSFFLLSMVACSLIVPEEKPPVTDIGEYYLQQVAVEVLEGETILTFPDVTALFSDSSYSEESLLDAIQSSSATIEIHIGSTEVLDDAAIRRYVTEYYEDIFTDIIIARMAEQIEAGGGSIG